MTETQKIQTVPEPGRENGVSPDGSPEGTEPQERQPEPMTPESVLKWNAYYDAYIVLGVLLLTFIVSSNRITHSSIWNQLTVGKEIARTGRPVTTNLFSYVEADKPWVNIPWLFDLASAVVFKRASDLSPVDPTDVQGSAAKAEQVGAGTLVALNALIRVCMALLILRIRKSGPGAWWSGICAALAVLILYSPLGAIAAPGTVSPATWGLTLLALELLLIYHALQGSRAAAFGLVPLFLLWANVDSSFLPGLMILAAVAIGRVFPSSSDAAGAFPLQMALGVLAACAAACLVNPSVVKIYPAALDWISVLFRSTESAVSLDQLSFFGSKLRDPNVVAGGRVLFAIYALCVAAGVGSFWLNRKRFNLSLFLAFAVVSALWGTMLRFGGDFAVVLAVVLALNGQQWYQDVFGAHGKLGAGWSVWSVGGRLVTIALLFLGIWDTITGYYGARTGYTFGFGFDPDDYPFEAARFLKNAPIKGNVLNTWVKQGDALVYVAFPNRKTYIDSRADLFSQSVNDRLQEARRGLAADDEATWKPFLDEYDISVVMIQPRDEKTYRSLSESPRWVPFHDDGNTVLFGRADAKAPEDRAFFKENRLDPTLQAYKITKGTPSPDRPPSDITWIDKIYQDKALALPQPHAEASRRWLLGAVFRGEAGLPEPARCLMAIKEARTALASKPDDTLSYKMLASAYRFLMIQEAALLAGTKLAPETAALVEHVQPRPEQLMTRFRQRVTALNYAIKTTPPPRTALERLDLQELNMELAQLYASVNFIDLARDRLRSVEDMGKDDSTDEARARHDRLILQLASMDEQVKRVETRMNDMSVEEQAPPLRLALFAAENGAPGLGLRELVEADNSASSPALVKPRLLDLYCDIGAPDKAVEMLTSSQIDDQNFGGEPGVSAMRQSRAYFLQGNTEYAATLWEKYAIPRLRQERSYKSLAAASGLARGEVQEAARLLLDIPDKIALQSNWEFEAGICRLEEGIPEVAADHFTQALKLVPKSAYRPIMAYYLEKIGRPVPPTDSVPEPKKSEPKPKDEKAAPPKEKDVKPEVKK